MTRDKLALKAAKKRDTRAIAEIEARSFIDPWSEKMLLDSFKNKYFRLKKLLLGGNIIGYVAYFIIADIEAEIAIVCVDESQRRKGYAYIMINALISALIKDKITALSLEVREGNVAARALYRKLGFKEHGIRPKYYTNGENAVIMWKDLT